MPWLEKLPKVQQILLVLGIFFLWCLISWFWYTCSIKGFCPFTPETNGSEVVITPLSDQSCAPLLDHTLALGSHNDRDEVRRLEHFLRSNTGARIASDGMFGPSDAAALRAYQTSRESLGLAPTGIADEATRALINSDACVTSIARN